MDKIRRWRKGRKRKNVLSNEASRRNKWIGLLDEPQKNSVWTWCIIICILGVVGVSFWGSYYEVVEIKTDDTTLLEIIDAASKKALPEIMMSIGTGVIGAAALNFVYRVYENDKLKKVKSLNYNEMLTDFFASLEVLDGKLRKNEEMRVEFKDFKDCGGNIVQELYTIKIQYEYETPLTTEYIKMKFERIYKASKETEERVADAEEKNRISPGISEYTSGINLGLIEYDFYWGNDETEGFPEGKVSDEAYKIYDVAIDHHRSDLRIEHNSYATGQGNLIEYTCSIPESDIDRNPDISKIRYTVEFPMERESIMFLNHGLPTQNTELRVDYRNIKEKTDVYIIPVTGSAAVERDTKSVDGVQYFRHTGWVTPNSGYIIAWWDVKD